jgi:hypothetical protein
MCDKQMNMEIKGGFSIEERSSQCDGLSSSKATKIMRLAPCIASAVKRRKRGGGGMFSGSESVCVTFYDQGYSVPTIE